MRRQILTKIKAIFKRKMSTKPTKAILISPVRNTTSLSPRSGPAAYARAVRRYNFDSPVFVGREGLVLKRETPSKDAHTQPHRGHPSRLTVPAPSQSHADLGPVSEVPAQDVQNDLEYVVPVTVGTPGVILHLDFDTGSSDLWVWSSELRVKVARHKVYDPAASSTSQVVPHAKWNISYGDGSRASGDVYTDTVQIGTLTIPNQAVELARKLSSSFLLEGGSDGLLGLAWPNINTVQPYSVLTPVANIIEQDLALGLFSVALDKGDGKGFYTFGGIDASRAGVKDSDIAYTPVDNYLGFWKFNSESAIINGQKVSQVSNTAILDTGTTLALVSDATANAIYSAIPGAVMDQQQGGWVYPTEAQAPTVGFAVGNKMYYVNCEDFAFADAGNGMTFGGIQSRGNNPFDILGDVFLKSIYAVFDQANVQIGVAQRSGNVSA